MTEIISRLDELSMHETEASRSVTLQTPVMGDLREEDYPKMYFWHEQSWEDYMGPLKGKTSMEGEKLHPLGFLEQKNGAPYSAKKFVRRVSSVNRFFSNSIDLKICHHRHPGHMQQLLPIELHFERR